MRDFLVGPTAVPSNGNIADGRIKWKDPVREVEEFEELAEKSGQGCSTSTVGSKLGELIVERHHYCREFRSTYLASTLALCSNRPNQAST